MNNYCMDFLKKIHMILCAVKQHPLSHLTVTAVSPPVRSALNACHRQAAPLPKGCHRKVTEGFKKTKFNYLHNLTLFRQCLQNYPRHSGDGVHKDIPIFQNRFNAKKRRNTSVFRRFCYLCAFQTPLPHQTKKPYFNCALWF